MNLRVSAVRFENDSEYVPFAFGRGGGPPRGVRERRDV